LPIVLTLTNHADRTATGTWAAGDGVATPVAITVVGSNVTLESTVAPAEYVGAVSADGSRLSGTLKQGSLEQPLTLTRVVAAKSAGDPVERWAAAVGGREKLDAVNAIYREGTIELEGGVGTLKVWHTADGRYRKEERGGTFARVETFDGVDALVRTGAAPVQRLAGPQLARAISQAYANTNAIFFAFSPERRRGELVVEGDHTIVLRPAGGIDWRVELDPTTGLPARMVHAEGERTIEVAFAKFDTFDGLRAESEIRRSTGDPRFDAVIHFTKTVLNPPIDDALFTIDDSAAAQAVTAR
jgi:hypothetical protein